LPTKKVEEFNSPGIGFPLELEYSIEIENDTRYLVFHIVPLIRGAAEWPYVYSV